MPDPMSKRLRSFFASPRLLVIGAILAATAVLLLLALLPVTNDEPSSTEEQATQEEAIVKRVALPAPSRDKGPEDEVPDIEDAAPSAPEQSPDKPAESGRGKIYGSVAMPGGAPVPEDMRVALHRYDSESLSVSYEDTLLETATPGPDGAFEFEDLALRSYALFATSAGHTMHTTATLTRIRTERQVTLRVVPGGAITGRVLNESDEPVEGAQVFTAAWNIGGQTRNAPRSRALTSRVTTDAEGAFVMGNLRIGAPGEQGYRLAVKAEGYATYLSDYMLSGTQDVDLILSFGGMVAGQLVHAETGEPAADMVVTLDSELAMENLSTTSDAEGWFFMTGVPPGSHQARLVDDELVVVPETARFDVAEGEQTADVLIEVAMGGRITGRVFDVDTGAGISRVKVRAAPNGFSLLVTPSAETDSRGRYQIVGLDAGAYGVFHDKPEGYPQNMLSITGGRRIVSAKLAGEISGVDFELTKGIQIFGKVVDEEGRPLQQAMVNGSAEAMVRASDYVLTKRDGSFALAGFPPQSKVHLSVSKSGYARESMDPADGPVEIDEANVEGVLIVMGTASSISGFVVDSLGNPVARLQVLAQSITPGGRGSIAATSADGAFTVDGLTAGEYRFQFSVSGMFTGISGPASGRGKTTRVAKGEKITGLKLVYDMPAGALRITGRVTDERGGPIPNATVRVSRPTRQNVLTGPDGTYTLTGLNESSYGVSASSSNYAPPKPLRVAAGSRNVNFVMKPYAAIEGQVLNADTGEPVTMFRVQAVKHSDSPRFRKDMYQSFQDTEGRFRLSRIQEGAAIVAVRAKGYSEARTEVNGIIGGETARNVVVRLEGGLELAGTVVNRLRQPIASAQIFLGPMPDDWRRNEEALARTNGEGQFRLTSLAAGDITLSASHEEYAPGGVTVNVSRYSENRVQIVLHQGGVVEGYVTLDGLPQPGQFVNASLERRSKRAPTDAAGHYRIVGLQDGTFNIHAAVRAKNGYRNQSKQADVVKGMSTIVDFDFAPGSAAIEGTVFEDATTPLRQTAQISATIQLAGGVTESIGTQIDQDGAYLMEDLPAGHVFIRVYAQGYPSKTVELDLGDGQSLHQDIFLFGGATIVCEISGAISGAQSALILAISGVVEIQNLDLESMRGLRQRAAATRQFAIGQARLTGLEAGTYTVLVIILDPGAATGGADPYATAQWRTSVIEVEKDEIGSAYFSF